MTGARKSSPLISGPCCSGPSLCWRLFPRVIPVSPRVHRTQKLQREWKTTGHWRAWSCIWATFNPVKILSVNIS
ncbi:hypothetical protein CICLE_v10033248mg [Citrus x clementina]|uniref:Uncharacterized protein n=1 Tax=Citrus clementina TaxID=85681 RepID=V4TD73_CITCL|nr:hypothetical protein CICLE_v10033248mg [Citrus x clementina]